MSPMTSNIVRMHCTFKIYSACFTVMQDICALVHATLTFSMTSVQDTNVTSQMEQVCLCIVKVVIEHFELKPGAQVLY